MRLNTQNTQCRQRGLEVLGSIITLILLGSSRFLPEQGVKVLLQPYVDLCKLFYNVRFSYEEGYGYICSTGTFAITSECLGNVFMAMVFVLLFFRFRAYVTNQTRWLGISCAVSIGLGYLIGSIRILASVPFAQSHFFGLLHGTIGILLYLGGLITINSIGVRYLVKEELNEKLI